MNGLASLLKPNGLLILHTINYPMLARRKEDPWGPVRDLADGSLVLKGFFPRIPGPWDGLLMLLEKKKEGTWVPTPVRFELHPHNPGEIQNAGERSGLVLKAISGGFEGQHPEDPESADLLYEFVRQ
jgi:hypothetical protein